jgi:hypothetical protein
LTRLETKRKKIRLPGTDGLHPVQPSRAIRARPHDIIRRCRPAGGNLRPRMNANYFFLHMPKCGGVSLHRLLAQDPYYFPVFAHRHVSLRADRYYRSCRGVGGHWPLRSAYRLGFRNAWKFTFLREPVERLVSHLVYAAMRDAPPPDWDLFRPDLEGIKAHLKHELGGEATTYCNCYVNYLGTTVDERAPVAEQVQSAVENLREFEFVGHQETFDADVAALLGLLGLPVPGEIPRENVSGTNPRAAGLRNELLSDAGCRDLLWECTASDRQVYEAVRAAQSGGAQRPASGPSGGGRLPLAVDLATPELRIVETSVEFAPDFVPGSGLVFNIVLEILAPELAFDVELTLETTPDGEAAVQLLSFNQLKRHLQVSSGLSLLTFEMPCWLNKGFYIGHLRIFDDKRTVIAEKVNAFQLPLYYFNSAAQFGSVYADVKVDVEDVSFRRRWPLEEAQKLRLSLDAGQAITVTDRIWTIPLVLQNESVATMSSRADCCYYVSFHLADDSGEPWLFDGHRYPLPLTPPGQVSRFSIQILVNDPRIRTIQLRLLQENVRWHEGGDFSGQGAVDLPVTPDGLP